MRRLARLLSPYLFVLLVTAAITFGMDRWREIIEPSISALTYLLMVVVATTVWGTGPGLVAAFAAFFAFNYFFIAPIYEFNPSRLQSLIELVIFIIMAVITSQLMRRAEAGKRAKQLEESDRLKSALLSSVSHELRTPLATIRAAATSLRSGEVDWDSTSRTNLLNAIDEEARHLNQLVGNLLDMSRIESGALTPDYQWNDLGDIVNSVLDRVLYTTPDQDIQIDFPDNLPLVPVDFVLMEQVFGNLLGNALKYASPGTPIQVTARVESSNVQVQVSNQGQPVAEEHLERLFDKFYRAPTAQTDTGTGMGLTICKGIIAAHGGCIWAESRANRFTIHFTLPLRQASLPAPNPKTELEAA